MAVQTPQTRKPGEVKQTQAVATPQTRQPGIVAPTQSVAAPKTVAPGGQPTTGGTQTLSQMQLPQKPIIPQQGAVQPGALPGTTPLPQQTPQTVAPLTQPAISAVPQTQPQAQPTAQPTQIAREQYVAPLPSISGGGLPTVSTGFKATGDAYSPENIQQAATEPVAKPDLSKTGTDLYDQFMNDPELVAARQKVEGLQAAQRARFGELDPYYSVLTGEAAMMQDEINAAQALVNATEQRQAQRYQIAQQQQDQINNLILQTGGNAGIKPTDDFATAVEKTGKYMETKAEKDMMTQMYTQVFGYPPSSKMSTKKMQKELEKAGVERAAFDKQMQKLEIAKKKAEIDKIKGSGAGVTTPLTFEQQQKYKETLDKQKSDIRTTERGTKKVEDIMLDIAAGDSDFANEFGFTEEQLSGRSDFGFRGAVGFGATKSLGIGAVSGTQRANFEDKVEQIKSTITLDNIQAMKGMGSLSNADLAMLASVESLNTNITEEQFKNRMRDIYTNFQISQQEAYEQYYRDLNDYNLRTQGYVTDAYGNPVVFSDGMVTYYEYE